MAESLSLREQLSGFPVTQMAILSIIKFSEPVAFSSMFPYVYFMIRDFGITKDDSDIAKYSGSLAAAFSFCQFISCMKWAAISDRIGRKPVLILGILGTSISIIAFGFSSNYWVALAARSMMGLSNGNTAVIRTSVGELITERNHQAVAFSLIPLLFNVGTVVGPMIGGSSLLTRPRTAGDTSRRADPDSFYERFITKYPYAPSNLLVAMILWFIIILAFLFLEETHKTIKDRRDFGLDIGDKIKSLFGYETPRRPWKNNRFSRLSRGSFDGGIQPHSGDLQQDYEESEFLGDLHQRNDSFAMKEFSTGIESPEMANSVTIEVESQDEFPQTTAFTKPVVHTIVSSFLTSLHSIVYAEFLPVLLAGNFMAKELHFPDRIKGGFGYSTSEIGKLLSTTGLMGSLSIVIIYPFLDRAFQTIHTYRAVALVFPITYTVLPYLIFTRTKYNSGLPEWLTPVLLYTLGGINSVCGSISFPNIMILIHRATKEEHHSYVNSSAASISSLARFVGPVIFGYIMSASERRGIVQASWMILSVLAIATSIQSFVMTGHDEELLRKVQLSEELLEEES